MSTETKISHLLMPTLFCLLTGAAHAEQTVPFKPGEDTRSSQTLPAAPAAPTGCHFLDRKLPANTIVIAAGSYSGRTLNFQIDHSNHAATQFDVAVHSNVPIALLLGSYDPAIWSIGWTRGTRIVAVFATGYHRQVVAGLPKNVPVITSSYEDKSPCGYNYFGTQAGLEWINPKARSVFGKPASRVYKTTNGLIDIVESTRPKAAYETSPATPPESFRVQGAPLAGEAGLEEAIANGTIRRMVAQDIEDVRAHYRAIAPGGKPDVPPVAGAAAGAPPEVSIPSISLNRGYVVLKPFVYPADLYGGNLAYFIVAKGVPAPTGNPGHSLVIDLNDNSPCKGVMCR